MSTASEILDELLAEMPDSYQKTIGFPTYDLLAAVSLRMEGTDEEIAQAEALLGARAAKRRKLYNGTIKCALYLYGAAREGAGR